MLGKKRDIIPKRKKNVSTRGKSLRVSIPNKGKQKSGTDAVVLYYCQNCVHLVCATSGYYCHADSNKVITESKQKWLTPNTGFVLREHPSSKNRGNRCPDWVQKIG